MKEPAIPRRILETTIGESVSGVATVDHPYTSPPIHLYAAHLAAMRNFGNGALLVNWDVSNPGDRTYRYDLITDTSLIAKNRHLFHYQPKIPYCNQSFNPGPWGILPECIHAALEYIGKRFYLDDVLVNQIAKRALWILDVSRNSYQDNITPWEYTKSILISFYTEVGDLELSSFYSKRNVSYWNSKIRKSWLPLCVREAKGKFAITSLLSRGVFKRRPFRQYNLLSSDDPQDLSSCSRIADKIESGELIPSLDVFLWSLALAGIKHYGNDFGFFERLATETGVSDLMGLQVSITEEQSERFLRLGGDFAVLLDLGHRSPSISRKVSHPSKLTRINSFGALYVNLGEQLGLLLRSFKNNDYSTKVIRPLVM